MCVTNSEVVEIIYNDNSFRGLCKNIAKREMIAQELHSEFILELLETKDNRLVDAYNDGSIKFLCVYIIKAIWSKRGKVKTTNGGKTNPLHEVCNYGLSIEDHNDIEAEPEEIEVSRTVFQQNKHKVTVEKIKEIIENERQSENSSDRFKASVYYHSTFTFKNPKQFHYHSKIPYQGVIIPNHKAFKEKLRKILSCNIY